MKLNLRQILPALLLVASSTSAKDITLNVPVDVKDVMAPLAMVGVWCYVDIDDFNGTLAGQKDSPFEALDAGGNFKGTLTVKMTGVDSRGSRYHCNLAFATAGQKEIYDFQSRGGPPVTWNHQVPFVYQTWGYVPGWNSCGKGMVQGPCPKP